MKRVNDTKKLAVCVDKLSFGYISPDACFSSASFSVCEGEKFVLLSGSHLGKSTLMRILSGLETNYIGKIELLGKTGSRIKESYKNVVFLPEKPVFLESKSVKDNLKFAYKTLMANSKNMDYVLKVPEEFLGKENVKISKLSLLDKLKFEFERALLKRIELLLIDRLVVDLKKECLKKKQDFSKFENEIKCLYRGLIESSKSVIIACENYDDIAFYGAEEFKVLYIYMGKIYRFESLVDFEKQIKEIECLKYFFSRKNTLMKLVFENGKYYFYETVAQSKNEFMKLMSENIKKRKILEKNTKKYIKIGIYEQKSAELSNLFRRKICLDKYPEIVEKIKNQNLENEEFFVVSGGNNERKNTSILNASDLMIFVCSTGERVL